MFGIIRPCRHRLGDELAAAWQAHLCGMCLSLRAEHGQLARLATNYDGLVVSVLAEAQAEAGRLFGRVAHLLDAVEDLAADTASGAWNPLAVTGADTVQARRLCDDALLGIRLALAEADFTDSRLVRALLVDELRRSVNRTFARVGVDGARPMRRTRRFCDDCCCDCCADGCCDACGSCDCGCLVSGLPREPPTSAAGMGGHWAGHGISHADKHEQFQLPGHLRGARATASAAARRQCLTLTSWLRTRSSSPPATPLAGSFPAAGSRSRMA